MSNVLLTVEGLCLLYQVQAGDQTQLGQGAFVLSASDAADGHVVAKVGDFEWHLEKSTPCLRTDDHTYTFAITVPNAAPLFYCAILPKEVGPSDIEFLQSVLASATAYSPSAAAAAGAEPETPAPAEQGAAGAVPADQGGARAAPDQGAYNYQQQQYQHFQQEQQQSGGRPSSALPESIKKGAFFLGSSLASLASAASASISAAKGRAESSLTPEARARLESAKAATKNNLEKVGSFAGRVASDVKVSANRLVSKVAESDLAYRSESVRSAFGMVYKDMQKAGDSVVQSMKEAAARVRNNSGPGGNSAHPGASMPPGAAPTGVPVSTPSTLSVPVSTPASSPYPAAASVAPMHGPPGEPVTGIPVSAAGYPAVPAQGLHVDPQYPAVHHA